MLWKRLLRSNKNWQKGVSLFLLSGRRMASGGGEHLVFVYGTLKTGEPNHYLLQEKSQHNAKLIGDAQTVGEYPLVITSQYNIPFLLDQKGTGKKVKGEVFRVSESMLAVLDELECHPTYYTRRLDPVTLLSSHDPHPHTQHNTQLPTQHNTQLPLQLNCWVYFLPRFRPDMLELPYLDSYSNLGSHGLPYVERYRRKLEDYTVSDDVHGVYNKSS